MRMSVMGMRTRATIVERNHASVAESHDIARSHLRSLLCYAAELLPRRSQSLPPLLSIRILHISSHTHATQFGNEKSRSGKCVSGAGNTRTDGW